MFQVVAITGRCVHIVPEASRGGASLPRLYSELDALLNCTCDCAMLALSAEAAIEDWRRNRLLNIQERFTETLGETEEQMMRSWVKQAWRANVVGDVESKVAALRERVVVALNTRDIGTLICTVNRTGADIGDVLPLPRLSPEAAPHFGAAWKRCCY